jgi:hypothetical protein
VWDFWPCPIGLCLVTMASMQRSVDAPPTASDGGGDSRTWSRRELIDHLGMMGAGALAASMGGGLVGVLGHVPPRRRIHWCHIVRGD